nr:MAG TPA: hypothetical protein [Caudoviricetes sp.]
MCYFYAFFRQAVKNRELLKSNSLDNGWTGVEGEKL